jgi:hypothetical protein
MEPSRARSALVAASLLVLILVFAGCADSSTKLSADATAQKLGQYVSRSYHVKCDPAAGSFWDYACTVTPPSGSKDKGYKMKVRVGPSEILDRAVCGARTGTSLNC